MLLAKRCPRCDSSATLQFAKKKYRLACSNKECGTTTEWFSGPEIEAIKAWNEIGEFLKKQKAKDSWRGELVRLRENLGLDNE